MEIVVVNSGRPFFDVSRYAIYSHPWQDQREGRSEVSCLLCRTPDEMPVVVWSGHKAGMPTVIAAIANHENDAHRGTSALLSAV